MKHASKIVLVLVVASGAAFAANLKQQDWHKPVREYEPRDSVLIPTIDCVLIQKIKVGMTFDEVKQIAGFAAVDYYIHPDYAVLFTKVADEYYEVALLHKKSKKIEAISYRNSPWKKAPSHAVEPTRAPEGARGSH